LTNKKINHKATRVLIAVWASLVLTGFAILESYANGPGVPAKPPAQANSPRDRNRLIVFIHPQCPCSRATLSELAQLQSDCGSELNARVEIFAPASMPTEWTKGDLYRQAKSIPGVDVHLDAEGKTAKAYRVSTSGQALLYSPEGQLVFSGGLTESRGHEGRNGSTDAIEAYVRTGHIPISHGPVFGCALGVSSQ